MMKKQIRAWNGRNFIFGFLIAVAGILINLKSKPEFKPESESGKKLMEKILREVNSLQKKTMSIPTPTQNCHFATSQGRRSYQEDRVTRDLNFTIPLLARGNDIEEVRVGAVAVFDGHIGSSASDMAARIFLDKFMVAFEYHLYAGSTSVVVLIYNNHVLVANVGDSKAFLCSQKEISHEDGAASLGGLFAKELTSDHNACVFKSILDFVPLLMGHFPMTRAIGDVSLKRYDFLKALIPEVTDWQSLTSKDEFLAVASDGIFESVTPQAVCDFLNEVEDYSNPSLLAHQLIQKAYLEGSNDNLSVVLVPLGSRDLL
ncbi:hypothetical protein R3W88_020867 [Solanum pinnatisectum]|uniref:PPM-type phosphatase domain-containing protein n=1 Tax=Solanum pinnatisectum TaxID=50273 RepID=A0AAV9KQP2_9SOLN|nr:hypothetical protein R3W88_020867 [Solanum pinnatisectum]